MGIYKTDEIGWVYFNNNPNMKGVMYEL